MYDYGLSTLEQYGLSAASSERTRGGLLCRTDQGPVLVKEFHGSEKKLRKQQQLLTALEEQGLKVDSYRMSLEGQLTVRDRDNIPYTLQNWQEGRECSTRSASDILKSVGTLAVFHRAMHMEDVSEYAGPDLEEEYRRRNRELRRIRRYIRSRGASCAFEKEYLSAVEGFLSKGEEALQMLAASSYPQLRREAFAGGSIIHGEFSQHNILLRRNGNAVINFDHFETDIQLADLYYFMRKILEKQNWDIDTGRAMLRAYHREKPISPEDWEYLKIRFTYPDKFRKISNYYYTHNKAWISSRNTEKLQKLIRQKPLWDNFITECFQKYPF